MIITYYFALAKIRTFEKPFPSFCSDYSSTCFSTTLHYNTCAVVGSGGSLLKHTYGKEISEHDVIIRANNPPVKGYETHVGNRTDINFLNQYWYKHLFPHSSCLQGSLSLPPTSDRPSQVGAVIMEFDMCVNGLETTTELKNKFDNLDFVCSFERRSKRYPSHC